MVAVRHVDGQRAVGEDDLALFRIHAAGIGHKAGLTGQGFQHSHADEALLVSLTGRRDSLRVEQRQRQTAGGVDASQQIKALDGHAGQIVLGNQTLQRAVYLKRLVHFLRIKAPGFQLLGVGVFRIAALVEFPDNLLQVKHSAFHAAEGFQLVKIHVAGNQAAWFAEAAELHVRQLFSRFRHPLQDVQASGNCLGGSVEDFALQALFL